VPVVRILKGMVLSRLGDRAGARREFEAALERSPTSLEALGGLVPLDLAARQPGAALEPGKGRVSRPDASPALLMLAARTFAAAGDARGAEQLLRRIIEKDARFLAAYSALGQLYLQQGRLDQALQEFESLAAKDPKPVAALTLAGIILQAQGRTADARARFERVLQVDSNAPVAANNLAWMIAESGGNLDVALQLAQTAHRGLPDSPEVSNTLGFVYYKKSLYTMAIPPLKASVDKDPTNPAYQLHLGLAYAKSGNSAAAREYLQRALTLKADIEGAAEAREVLATLKAQG
jgi:tetratricopeptide (TPR) repeat protein